ncbi:hypothetical protein [Tardiphaga sp. 367_B4_N1_1]|uniref:hypothetical protein n=1 Tax=Tardiphaga sp. 367_B4_N1_1 TaxID=3240777 RepID=UPI003F26C699
MIKKSFTVATNEDWRDSVILADALDLTDAVALMQVKPSAGHPDDWIDLSSEAGANDEGLTFTLDLADKKVSWIVPQDRVWEVPPGKYAFDVLVIYASGQRRREALCDLTVVRGITDAVRADPVNVLDLGPTLLETE